MQRRPTIRRSMKIRTPVRREPIVAVSPPRTPDVNRIMKRTLAAIKIQKTWIGRGPYEWIMYSGTANISNPDLKSLFESPLKNMVTEVSVRSGRKILATHTREYGIKSDLKHLYYDQLTIKGNTGQRAFAINVYKSGKVTFTGGYPFGAKSMTSSPKSVLKNILGKVSDFSIKSSTIQFDSGFAFDRFQLAGGGFDYDLRSVTSGLARIGIQPGDISAPARNVNNPVQTKPFVTVNVHPEIIRIFPNGQVQITKITNNTNVNKVVSGTRIIMRRLAQYGSVKKRNFEPPKSRKTHAQQRNTDSLAPNISTRSTTCPKNRRPTPYSFGGAPIGPGFYIGANPQGLPCCYKIPKKIGYLKGKIIDRFRELGVQIPQSAKLAFHINLNNSNKPVNVSNIAPGISIFIDKGELKIGTRQAKRWPLVKLVDIAHKLGAVYITYKSSKDDVIAAIEKESKKSGSFNTKNSMRIENKRNIRHFSKTALLNRVRKVYGVRLNDRKSMVNLVSNVKRLQNTKRFKELYNSIMPIHQIPENFKNTFFNSAKNNYMGKSNENIRKGLMIARNHILETIQ